MVLALVLNIVAAFEPFHSACGINNLLFTGKERMAFTAELNLQILTGGTDGEGIAARTGNSGFLKIFRMYLISHIYSV